jgi:uncharacterized protein (DUF1330 family)
MLYVTQLIYIKQGKESIFDEFEQIAIPIIKNYNGRLLLRSRPTHTIESTIDPPYEIHLVEFNTENDLFYSLIAQIYCSRQGNASCPVLIILDAQYRKLDG